jgi:hypothetical protein
VRVLKGGYLNGPGIIKQGHSVIRYQDHPWPKAVSEALNVLACRGFDHSPRELARIDPRTVILTYMPGRALPAPVPQWAAAPATLLRVTHLFKRFSAAAEGVGHELTYSDWLIPPMSDGAVLVHGDPHPTNIVFNRRKRPTAIIDFELATLGTHDWNLMSMLFSWAPLEPIHLTCWKLAPHLRIAERISTILQLWPPSSLSELHATAHAFVNWRRAWIAELSRLGNHAAVAFMRDPTFDSRYEYAIDLLHRQITQSRSCSIRLTTPL